MHATEWSHMVDQVAAEKLWQEQQTKILEDLQIIQSNFYRDTIKAAVADLPDPPMTASPFKPLRDDIIHLLLRRKMGLPAATAHLGLPRKNHSAVAMQLHQFCREKNLDAYNRLYVYHMLEGDVTDRPRPPRDYLYHTAPTVVSLQLNAEKFLPAADDYYYRRLWRKYRI
jgi:hypothetical protein